jgi:hypothetical protein
MAEPQDGTILRVQPEQARELILGLVRPGNGPLRLLLALTGHGRPLKLEDFANDAAYQTNLSSRALIHALIILSQFAGGGDKGVRQIAGEIGMSPTTAGRFLRTWKEVGVLQQDPRTHRYRLAAPPPQP